MSRAPQRPDSARLDKAANEAALTGCPINPMSLKEVTMNAKNLFAAAALAVIGTSAFAGEATEFAPQAGALTRAEVSAELARAQAAGEIATVSASYGSFAPVARAAYTAVDAQASRAEVRAEARAAARANVNSLYVGG
jgi:hypothetical protein